MRYEWKNNHDQTFIGRQPIQNMPGYDIDKCMVRKQTRATKESQPDMSEDTFPDSMNFSEMFDPTNF